MGRHPKLREILDPPLHILMFMFTHMYDIYIEWKIASEHRACFRGKPDIDYDTW